MKTSYFAKVIKSDINPSRLYAIANGVPNYFKGSTYKKLVPPWSIVQKYKNDKDEKSYTEVYTKLILDRLDPEEVWNDLGSNAILVCWEKSGSFCHRRLVADWLELNLDVKVSELGMKSRIKE